MPRSSHELVRRSDLLPAPTYETVDGDWSVPLLRELVEVQAQAGVRLVALRKRPVDPAHRAGAVLLVHGLGQNRYSWDLPQRSLANYLVAHGYEVYLAELRGHGLSRANGAPYPDCFEAYAHQDLPALVRHASALSGQKRIFLIGHSLGGSIAYSGGPQIQEYLRGIISLAGPSHLGRGLRVLPTLAQAAHLVGGRLPLPLRAWRRLPHLSVDVLGTVLVAALPLFDLPLHRLPWSLWYPRSIESPILAERIKLGFDRTGIPIAEYMLRWAATGRFASSCGTVDYAAGLQQLKVPILFAVGRNDAVVPPASIEVGFERTGSRDKSFRIFEPGGSARGWGHIDVVCGKAAPRVVWPALLEWMGQH